MSAFSSPNYTQCPNDFFDMMADMRESELKVTLALIRQTFGYHRRAVFFSLSDMQELTGLSRQGVLDGAEAAEKRGTLKRITDGGVSKWVVNVVDRQDGQAVVNTVDQQNAEVVNAVDQGGQRSRPPSNKQSSKEKDSNKSRAKTRAPEPPPAGGNEKRPPIPNQERKQLEALFTELTGLQPKPPTTEAARRENGRLWWTPLRDMIALANGNSADVLREAVGRLRGRVTIASPRSVESTFAAIVGERRTAGNDTLLDERTRQAQAELAKFRGPDE